MKTLITLKRLIAASSLSLLMTASTAVAQDSPTQAEPQAQQTTDSQVNDPALQREPPAQDQSAWDAQMRQSDDEMAAGREINEPAGADNQTNWSWLGLLGLLGLFGLKRRHDVHDENYRTVRT